MKKRPIAIKLKDDLMAHLESVHDEHREISGRIHPPEEIWQLSQNIIRLRYVDKSWTKDLDWGLPATNDISVVDELVKKRNSLPCLFMKLDMKPDVAPVTIAMDGNSEAIREKTGVMTIFPNERYPAEEWIIHEKGVFIKEWNIGPLRVCTYTLYCDEGAWSLWIDAQLNEKIVLNLGLRLAEKRNALKPSSSEQTLNLALDRVMKMTKQQEGKNP